MADRELLEKAARAYFAPHYHEFLKDHDMKRYIERWHPLDNDAHAFRLAAKLGITFEVDHADKLTRIIECHEDDYEVLMAHAHFDGGAEAATRRAIVRAAAAMAGGE